MEKDTEINCRKEGTEAENKKPARKCKYIMVSLISIISVCAVAVWYFFLCSFGSNSESGYLYIDADDNLDSVRTKLADVAQPHQMAGFNTLCMLSSYGDRIHTGRYEIAPSVSTLGLFRTLKRGNQSPLRISVPSTWTKEMVAGRVAAKLMTDSASIADAMNDPELCKSYGLDTNTIASVLIPNTYEMYWNISPEKFVDRMYRESEAFWNKERVAKAETLGLSRTEVMTLASIVDGETANNGEKPMIAGLYLNRLRMGMPLQSDPTVKYALRNFALRRIYNDMLLTPSPYNTYVNKGLPPSPIRIPAVSSIDAVLDHVKHGYLFMCAKEDFSGTHNFAESYSQHRQNARKYVKALNTRKIK